MSLATPHMAPRPIDQRRHQRVAVALHGRLMLPDHSEHECMTVDMSPGGVFVQCKAQARVNERVIAYLETVGRIEGKVARVTDSGFAMTISATLRRRDKLASQLTWLANRSELGLPEDRRHERVTPRTVHAKIVTAGGGEIMGRFVDISLSGAAISTDTPFQKGDLLLVNQTPSKVVRIFDRGIAVEFLRAPAPDAFEV